jgi:cation diffusion facilitator CzcD-associated flavoprotein CzcO
MSPTGQFSTPKKAPVAGLDAFKGEEWHTGSWPAGASIKGKRVAIVGTGPSAAQLLPKIYKDCKSLVVYQRSPSYVLPRDDYVVSNLRKWIFAYVPFVMRFHKWSIYQMVSHIVLLSAEGVYTDHGFRAPSSVEMSSLSVRGGRRKPLRWPGGILIRKSPTKQSGRSFAHTITSVASDVRIIPHVEFQRNS